MKKKHKRKNLRIFLLAILVIVLIIIIVNKDKSKENKDNKTLNSSTEISSSEELIYKFQEYFNSKDEKKIVDLFNIEELKKFIGVDIDKEYIENTYKKAFSEEDMNYKINQVTKILDQGEYENLIGDNFKFDELDNNKLEENSDNTGDEQNLENANIQDTENTDLEQSEEESRENVFEKYDIYYIEGSINQFNIKDMFIINEKDNKFEIVCALNTLYYSGEAKEYEQTLFNLEFAKFNYKFENYSSDEIIGANVKSLMSEIDINNRTENNKLITVEYITENGSQVISPNELDKLNELRDNIENTHNYGVEFSYETGIINNVKIKY